MPQAPLMQLGAGDLVRLQVAGRPELSSTLYVSDDGTVAAPLAGRVFVAGKSPADAAQAIANALRAGQYLVNPQVSLVLDKFQSQRISILGEVRSPGRIKLESHTTVFDALAEAGGTTELAADRVFVMRAGADGDVTRLAVQLRNSAGAASTALETSLRAGDAVYVPKAEQFYIYGEVNAANAYRLETDMTVVQAISRGGGITSRGSLRRVEIQRHAVNGSVISFDASLSDRVQADDVIRVKERLF